MSKQYSLFRISHKPSLSAESRVLGSATMSDNNIRFKPNAESGEFFIEQKTEWLTDFQKNMRKLVRSVGHAGRFSYSYDEVTGIEVERL